MNPAGWLIMSSVVPPSPCYAEVGTDNRTFCCIQRMEDWEVCWLQQNNLLSDPRLAGEARVPPDHEYIVRHAPCRYACQAEWPLTWPAASLPACPGSPRAGIVVRNLG